MSEEVQLNDALSNLVTHTHTHTHTHTQTHTHEHTRTRVGKDV